jgi:dGTPase
MLIRELFEREEVSRLSPYATLSSKTRGREMEEEECQIRTAFQRDRDRIIHSKSFRQLKYKTQVFLIPEVERLRTRLTHTIEVSQIARTIARALKLNEDLTEAIALGHDLGHPPFGHMGEMALNEVFPGGFSHSKQSLRIVEVIEKSGAGLNLTWETRDGILKHSRGEAPLRESENQRAETLEGDIVRVADSIAYINHDIEDALVTKLIGVSDLPYESLQVLGKRHSTRINTMVQDVIENSFNTNQIRMSERVLEATDKLRSYLYAELYTKPEIRREGEKAKRILQELFRYYVKNPKHVLDEFYFLPKETSIEQIVCDHIAGLSDREALAEYERIFLPKPWML